MIIQARKVHRTVVAFGVACAVMAALPCVAGDASPALDTVTVKSKSAPAEENIGFLSGLAIGAVAAGPVGAVAGGITGALLGEHYHKQKVANHQLAADLSGSNADKAQLGATLAHARELTMNITFRTGDANLTADDIDQLTTLGQLAGGMPGVKIRVSGHADPRGSMGLGGKRFSIVGFTGNAFQAIDYRTGKSVWRHVWPGSGGTGTSVLATASGLLFTGDTSGNFVAMDAANGALLWHSGIGNISGPPETYSLDGHQYVLASVGDAMYSFVLN